MRKLLVLLKNASDGARDKFIKILIQLFHSKKSETKEISSNENLEEQIKTMRNKFGFPKIKKD